MNKKYFLLYGHFNGDIDEFFGIFDTKDDALIFIELNLKNYIPDISIDEVSYFPHL